MVVVVVEDGAAFSDGVDCRCTGCIKGQSTGRDKPCSLDLALDRRFEEGRECQVLRTAGMIADMAAHARHEVGAQAKGDRFPGRLVRHRHRPYFVQMRGTACKLGRTQHTVNTVFRVSRA